jgi:hypothetical protein
MWRKCDMEKFKAKVQKRVLILSMTVLFIGVIYLILISGLVIDTPTVPDFIRGFNMGAFAGVELILVFFIVKYFVAMKKEDNLKKLYIEENDERSKLILEKTGAFGMLVFTILCAIGAIVAGFFDETVFYTLLCVTALSAIIRGACKLYYHMKL